MVPRPAADASPVALNVQVAGFFFGMKVKTHPFESLPQIFHHVGVAADENAQLVGIRSAAQHLFNGSIVKRGLDATDVALLCLISIRPSYGWQVGESSTPIIQCL